MSTITFGDLCHPCKIFTEGLVAQWLYAVEGAFVGSGDAIDSVEMAQASVNAVWILKFRNSMFVPGSETFKPPRVFVEPTSYAPALLGGQGLAEYDVEEHKIVISPDAMPISRRSILHEISHGVKDRRSKDRSGWNESHHGQLFVRGVFNLYKENGLLLAGIDPEKVSKAAGRFQEAATNRSKCAFQVRSDTLAKRVFRKILPSRLTRH